MPNNNICSGPFLEQKPDGSIAIKINTDIAKDRLAEICVARSTKQGRLQMLLDYHPRPADKPFSCLPAFLANKYGTGFMALGEGSRIISSYITDVDAQSICDVLRDKGEVHFKKVR